MKKLHEQYEVVVCGGGLAGFCAAIASARNGAKTCLVQDRPVFGGNSSSEIRVTPHGAAAFHSYARETGIISELLIEERAKNHEPIVENGWTNSIWDLTMYNMAMTTPNLTFHLNTAVTDVIMKTPSRLESVLCRTTNAELTRVISATTFIDCTGDGTIAALAGCECKTGSEGRDEYNEPHAPAEASADVMGSSLHFKAKDVGFPSPFVPPVWAVKYDDPAFFYEQGREPKELKSGYWWIEIGVPWDTIHQNEEIRHELTRHILGVWDWIKNKDPKTRDRAENLALDWIGQVPGKRESRRIVGQYWITENDIQNKTVFPDEIAFGGWFIDLHTPGGLLASTSEAASAEGYSETSEYAAKSYAGPYGVPLRSLISKDVDNLMMAGRNVSATHAALATIRVMGTTALMGEAAGTTAALASKLGYSVIDIANQHVTEVQQTLLRSGCFLPNVRGADPLDIARKALASASSSASVDTLEPESRGFHKGLHIWRDQARPVSEALQHMRGQWIALGCDRINTLSVLLSNDSTQTQFVPVRLFYVDSIWDYRCEPGTPLAEGILEVPVGLAQWASWPLNLSNLVAGRYVRLDLLACPSVHWHIAGRVEPGHVSAFQISAEKMRRYGSGVTMSFQVDPPQRCFEPQNVLTGVTRPQGFTNLWRSNPGAPLPQWLQLTWKTAQKFDRIELTFPGHLLREYHAYSPFYRDPQCPKDYAIQVSSGDAWITLITIKDNFQRRRIHKLQAAVTATELRILVTATNGDPSAQIYEIRVYSD
jgi:ribulose 1,5-bisphosphate synthetase/thiazole synthase